MIAEAVGGWFTNSLALIADAGHMLTDVAALGLTIGAIWFASRPATAKKTFGWYRLEILAADELVQSLHAGLELLEDPAHLEALGCVPAPDGAAKH